MRAYTIILLILFILTAGVSLWFWQNQNNDSEDTEINPARNKIAFTKITSGYNANFKEKNNYVIKTQSQWQEIWEKIHNNNINKPVLPVVDFDNEMVIAVFDGQKSSGGYSVKITKIEAKDNNLKVYIQSSIPGNNCGTTAALTQPYYIAKTSVSDKEVKFIESNKTTRCE